MYKNKGTSLWKFIANFGLREFRHGRSIVFSQKKKLIDRQVCWSHLRWQAAATWLKGRCFILTAHHCSYGDRTFAAAGPRLWNSLPVQLRNPDITYGLFRRHLKGHFFREAWTLHSVTSDMRRHRKTPTYLRSLLHVRRPYCSTALLRFLVDLLCNLFLQ